jgi:hypothetical protein
MLRMPWRRAPARWSATPPRLRALESISGELEKPDVPLRLTNVARVVLILLIGAVPCFAQDSTMVPPSTAGDARDGGGPTPVANNHELLQKYVWSTLGLEGALSATLSGGLDQWRESPAKWGKGSTSYARRWTSEYTETAIGDTATYAIARVFHQDPSFTRCECSGFVRRMNHAVLAPFTARTRDGKSVLSFASLAGFLTGDVVSASTWFPARLGARDGLRNAVASLAARIGVDVLLEFRPRRPK